MPLTASITALATATAACLEAARAEASGLGDDELLEVQALLGASARQVELASAALAAEIFERSRPELGYSGLAQRRGVRTPEALVQQATGGSAQTARRLVRVGVQLATPTVEPWLAPIVRLVADGVITTESIELVRSGLGAPSSSVSSDALLDAATTLAQTAPGLAPEALAARAREARDALDSAGVAVREAELRSRRSLRLFPQPDGMTRLVGLLDPESAAIVGAAVDAATSPRRGGPRFVDPAASAAADRVVVDPRSTEQLALDALVELVDVAVRSADSATVGARRPDVRVLVTQRDLDRRTGVGFIDGQSASISVATVERNACDGGLIPIMFDDSTGAALNLGRSQRLHSARQRIVISARDGGCIAPACERPAEWCEVHHIHEFSKGGSTTVDDGVLLCRHHHMLVHNNGWRITRLEHDYWLVPPPDVDSRQTPIPLRSKSAAVRRLVVAGAD